MDLMEMLMKSGAGNSVGELAGTIGLGDSQAKDLIGALGPALTLGLQRQTEEIGGMETLQDALSSGNHQQYIDRPELMQSNATREDGNKILGHLLGSKDASRNVAAQAAKDTGIDAALIKKALPLVAGLAMGVLSKNTGPGAPAGSDSGLGVLLGGMLGGSSTSAGGVGSLIGLAKKLF